MNSKAFCYPITVSLLKQQFINLHPLITNYRNVVQALDFEKEMTFFASKGAMKLEDIVVDSSFEQIILDVNRNVMVQFSREFFSERPKRVPEQNLKRVQISANKKFNRPNSKKNRKGLDREKLLELLSNPTPITEQMRRNFEIRARENLLEKERAQMPKLLDAEGKPFKLKDLICEHKTRRECYFKRQNPEVPCSFKHYVLVLLPYTKELSGICKNEVINTSCRNCKCHYLHYRLETDSQVPFIGRQQILYRSMKEFQDRTLLPSQWINCDLRVLDYSVLGKFDAIMLDPPWDIHMNLPYMTLKDKEMKILRVDKLQDNGVCFLWVTGRALELGRDCLRIWGYKRTDELVWIKTNKHGKLIRTGRTGHWLNHSKEHCLVGYKGDFAKVKRNLDCDVLVSPVRETSRKPDEIYDLIERMMPGGRYCELFARPHNRRRRWMSLGNQLPGVYLVEDDVVQMINERYPSNILTRDKMDEFKRDEENGNLKFLNAVYFNHLFRQQT